MIEKAAQATLLGLVKKAQAEELENIKRARRNARMLATQESEPYQNTALVQLTKEIASLSQPG